jgi:hypothetical protein
MTNFILHVVAILFILYKKEAQLKMRVFMDVCHRSGPCIICYDEIMLFVIKNISTFMPYLRRVSPHA